MFMHVASFLKGGGGADYQNLDKQIKKSHSVFLWWWDGDECIAPKSSITIKY